MATTKKWILQIPVRIKGETSVGDVVDMSDIIKIPLYAADLVNAEARATEILEHFKEAAEAIDWEFFRTYCSVISDEDDLTFGDILLMSPDGKTKQIGFQIPRLIGGP